jgi:hypothetical protein
MKTVRKRDRARIRGTVFNAILLAIAFQPLQATDYPIAVLASRTDVKKKRRIPAMSVVTGSLFAV